MSGAGETPPAAGPTGWRRAGAVLQGLVLGPLVAVAVLNLIRVASDAQIFRYQGF